MAKRKRLEVGTPPAVETKETAPGQGAPAASGGAGAMAPVAQVTGQAAGMAALQEMSDFIATARAEGRLVAALPLGQIEVDHLQRDRLMPEAPGTDEDMQALIESLRARGQQVPIDVVRLRSRPGERYGLISGMRRVTALRALHAETREARFSTVKARVIRPETLPAAYLSMVEENEIRAGVSFYERARVAVKAVEAGAFTDLPAALKGLYGNVSRAKRSKIGSFAEVVSALDGALRFPAALSEKRGLALVAALRADPALAGRLVAALDAAGASDASAEQKVLTTALTPPKPTPEPTRAAPVDLRRRGADLVLSGPGVTPALQRDLAAWLAARDGE
ncbi:ParB/RepB/Spo0J family partition protein [Jannaschia marina]|uniref:ParB/RepB/Spo0J family partition protein n=1 Tax=Jannaschia marina TaxID=2741674 RepID=UPI0015C7BDBB|nr:ParB N-terminal domain-containing protein [Jannaschia marina]